MSSTTIMNHSVPLILGRGVVIVFPIECLENQGIKTLHTVFMFTDTKHNRIMFTYLECYGGKRGRAGSLPRILGDNITAPLCRCWNINWLQIALCLCTSASANRTAQSHRRLRPWAPSEKQHSTLMWRAEEDRSTLSYLRVPLNTLSPFKFWGFPSETIH